MKYKCHSCVFKGEHRENEKPYQICKRKWDLLEAISECTKPGVCPHHTTRKEADVYKENKL